MKKILIVILVLVGLLAVAQLFRPATLSNIPARELSGVPPEVNEILRKSCFDCHSSQTNLRWYDQLSPASFFVHQHIADGRKALDFSKWDSMATPVQNSTLYYALNKVLENEMPLPAYTLIHRSARPSAADVEVLKSYIFSRTPRRITDTAQLAVGNRQYAAFINGSLKPKGAVKPAPNGIEYIPDYRSWKLMSTSDRFDNGTIRLIFANDIAVKAIQEHHSTVWPDGAVFAKAAWKAQVNADSSITAGAFWQVEFMIKDATRYASTAGWGWARWRGDDLKPYGNNARFTNECVSCHQPVKGNDFVFTQPLTLIPLPAQRK